MMLVDLDPYTDTYSMISHLSHVAQDAATTNWPAVRTWTTTCLDYIQEGNATWDDCTLFGNERSRLVWAQTVHEPTAPAPCPAFNNDACKKKHPHPEGSLSLLHTCAICYYAAPQSNRLESSTHSAKSCTRKRRNGGRDEWESQGKHQSKRHNISSNTYTATKKETPESKSKN